MDFTYDAAGRVIRKETDIGVQSYTYNNQGKLEFYDHTLKEDDLFEDWARYSYENNNLVDAENSDGVFVYLQYDDNENINVMRSNENTLYVSYNKNYKPIKITVKGLGSIDVTYDIHGDIDTVTQGSGGHEISLEVTEVFHSILVVVNTTKDRI